MSSLPSLLVLTLCACESIPKVFAPDADPVPDPAPEIVVTPSDIVSEHIADLPEDVSGICADDEHLFATHDGMIIREYDLDTLARVSSHGVPSAPGPSVLGDCAIHDDILYYANVGQNLIGRLSLVDGTHHPDWATSAAGSPRAVATDADGLVWVSSDGSPDLHALDPESGLVAVQIPGPGLCNACEGLAAVEEGLWCTDTCDREMVLIGWDGTLLEELYTARTSWYGLTFVGEELWGGPTQGFSGSLWRISREQGRWGAPVR